jgi:hypothetical protein
MGGQMDRTIIYYTANTENEIFEQRIRDDLKRKAGDIPIVSVSRKPIDLGTNICVGEQSVSYTSEWKQLLIGLKEAKTKYCIAAEADCLYPPEYFEFTPLKEKMMYNYVNIWIVWKYKRNFWKKRGYCEGAQMCDREYWIERLEPLLPEKWESYTRPVENDLVKRIFPSREEWTGRPIISFKTRDGVSFRTTFHPESKTHELLYWGNIEEVKKILL